MTVPSKAHDFAGFGHLLLQGDPEALDLLDGGQLAAGAHLLRQRLQLFLATRELGADDGALEHADRIASDLLENTEQLAQGAEPLIELRLQLADLALVLLELRLEPVGALLLGATLGLGTGQLVRLLLAILDEALLALLVHFALEQAAIPYQTHQVVEIVRLAHLELGCLGAAQRQAAQQQRGNDLAVGFQVAHCADSAPGMGRVMRSTAACWRAIRMPLRIELL
ncbi:MAG: hypothetical protein U5R48_11980 [Gammaproteobacteria bacterium]|nr:hypothetical protein [Gammaproteobacteria bacterium]